MPDIETTLETRIFGGRWAPAERAATPAWVQIEEQMADRIESGALHAASGCRRSASWPTRSA